MFVVASSAVVGFLSVLIGRWLHLDYSAKLWAMTFVLVVMVRTVCSPLSLTCSQFLTVNNKQSSSMWTQTVSPPCCDPFMSSSGCRDSIELCEVVAGS